MVLQDESGEQLGGQLEQRLMGAAQRLHAALTDLMHRLRSDPDATLCTAVAGVAASVCTLHAALTRHA